MAFSSLIASFVFGLIGLGMFLYGKRTCQFFPLLSGALLMVVPYFVPNLMVLVAICAVLVTVPMLLRTT
jgi:hypothetical protein